MMDEYSQNDSLDIEQIIYPLRNPWQLFFHAYSNKMWRPLDYVKQCKISSINDFWGLYNHLEKLDMKSNEYYLMREGITPMWEDIKNRKGTLLSVLVPGILTNLFWTLLSASIVGETFSESNHMINGISIKLIMNNHKNKDDAGGVQSLIKIWVCANSKDAREGFNKFIKHILPSHVQKEWRDYSYSIKYKKMIPEY